jgi:hypothetical protein
VDTVRVHTLILGTSKFLMFFICWLETTGCFPYLRRCLEIGKLAAPRFERDTLNRRLADIASPVLPGLPPVYQLKVTGHPT